jgi:hypothetical protein
MLPSRNSSTHDALNRRTTRMATERVLAELPGRPATVHPAGQVQVYCPDRLVKRVLRALNQATALRSTPIAVAAVLSSWISA